MNCDIIAIGSELLTPYRQDTNSLYLTEKLNQLGVRISAKTIVGDRRAHLVHAVRNALDRADIVITMGGLGPTEDDLTREARRRGPGPASTAQSGDCRRPVCTLRRTPHPDHRQQHQAGRCHRGC